MIAGDERFVIFLQTITLKVHLPTFSGPETLKGVPIPDSYGIPEYRADQISGYYGDHRQYRIYGEPVCAKCWDPQDCRIGETKRVNERERERER